MTQHQWFYSTKSGQNGPVNQAELAELAAAGTIGPADLVWRDGLGDWIAASKVSGLFAKPAPEPSTTLPQATGVAVAPLDSTAPANVLPYVGGGTVGQDSHASELTVQLLSQTRPWVFLVSVFMFLGAALVGAGGLFMFAMSFINGSRGFGLGSFGTIAGGVYLFMAMGMFVPALYLRRYARRISNLKGSRRVEDLESALDAQRAYWKFVGILTCIVVGFYVVILLFALLAGLMR